MNSEIRMVEVATGHVSNRSQVIELSNVPSYIFPMEEETETYHSWYVFDEQLQQHIKNVGTIQGYNGCYYVNNIILDYDKKDLTDKQLYDAVHFLVNTEMIEDLGIKPEHINIWYSGTGYHIEMPNLFGFAPSTTLPAIVKETLTNVFPECDSIYDGARLIRAPYSYNEKLGNYKVLFTVDSFNFLDNKAISKASKNGFTMDELQGYVDIDWSNIEPYLKPYIKYPEIQQISAKETVRSQFRLDPNSVVTCMQNVLAKKPITGERNITMMRIGSWMRRCGMPMAVVSHTLATWTGLKREAEECTKKIFEQGYEYGCTDVIMAKNCKPNCIYFKHKDYNMNVMNVDDLAEKFAEFVQKDFSSSAFNFKDVYQMPEDFMVLPGELVIVTGNTGLGKSTFVMNLVANLPTMNTLFLSLENTWHLTFRRFLQMTHGLTKQEAIDAFKNPDDRAEFQKAFEHIQISCDPPELSRLVEGIARSKPKIVVVDTTDMIFVKGIHDEISKMNEIINGLKAVAQSQDCIVIAVHHVNKEAMREGISRITSLKGTTNVVQKADKVLAINGENNEIRRMVHSEKARDEGYMQLMFEFQKDMMQFNQVAGHGGFNG